MAKDIRRGSDRRKEKSEEFARIERETALESKNNVWEKGPKKQYVRINGWREIIQYYIESRKSAGVKSPIKILTLPGPKAIDIGLFYESDIVIRDDNGKINVAICDEGIGSTVANKLRKIGDVLAYSDRRLEIELSDDINQIPQQFPFDVINLDFCKTLIPWTDENFKTLERIFEYQRGQSFLLLLTAREYPDPKAKKYIICNNLKNEKAFREKYEVEFGSTDINLCLSNKTRFSQIVYPKLIANLAKGYRYKTIERFVACYTRENRGYYMVSHTFEFVPINRTENEKYIPRKKFSERDRTVNRALMKPKDLKEIEESRNAYSVFIPSLLVDRSIYVDMVLENDDKLSSDLENQGNQLIDWLDIDD